jgi:hypothetical protein
MKSMPELPAQPFRAIEAIGAVKAPPQSYYIEYNHENKQNEHFHDALPAYAAAGGSSRRIE